MKKIMFNDKYGLTQAVLEGRKTMTRRTIPQGVIEKYYEWRDDVSAIGFADIGMPVHIQTLQEAMILKAIYEVGEVIAIAQAYKDIYPNADFKMAGDEFMTESSGWNNKMFVKAKSMPHHIKITNIRVERLQDISDEDCLKEGIVAETVYLDGQDTILYTYFGNNTARMWRTPREAFAALIDKVSGKETWERNPWVFAYSFERVD